MSPEPPSYRNELQKDPNRGAAALMVILGFILLLPGVCSLLGSFFLFQSRTYWESPLLVIWLLGLVIGAFGVVIIIYAMRGRDSDRSNP
jgi:hypothetical protein